MTNPVPDLQLIFAQALELESPADRARYVVEACGDDQLLRREVESLLEAFLNAGAFLETPVMSAISDEECGIGEEPGMVIGRYKLLEVIGEGGMGVVYMAEQSHPIRRRVALKIIKPGMDSRQVIARFEAERQALALMDHPNIAKVFDAGATESGRPYFVMELVKGIPITEYCDQLNLTPRERLELLVPVCHAIHHAHQKGIIHRDIKPSNVLVSLYDGRPVPKVIDFGVAKAIEQRLTEKTLFTRHGAIVGTLRYMSPEQAENSALDVDTRTDIYSLGVLLFELLTGTTPLEHRRVKEAGYLELLNRIREEDAPKLSSRLSKTKELASIAAHRNMEPAKLARLVRGELEWIAMKALDRERNRRYETANDLARDLLHYLADEPVEAVPPSASYQVWKYARKHRVALATLGAFAAVLIAATAISAWEAVLATREGAKATRSADETKTVLGFFRDHVLAAARPEGRDGGLGYEVKLHEAVDAAEPTIAAKFAGQPTVEAAIRDTLGSTYLHLGRPADAIGQFERALALRSEALGVDDPDTLTSMNNLAVAYRVGGRASDAIPLHQRELEYCRARLGPEHPDTLKSMNNLAGAYRLAGRPGDAIPLFEKVLAIRQGALGPDHPETLTTMNNLAVAYRMGGRVAEAIALHERDLERSRRQHGVDHLDTLTSMDNLASAYLDIGRLDDALRLFGESLALRRTKLGPDHLDTLISRSNLASAYQVAGRTAEAVRMLDEVVALRRSKLTPDHPDTLKAMSSLALAHQEDGQTDAAVKMLEDVLRLRRSKLGPGHPDSLKTMNDLAGAYLEMGRWRDAELVLRPCLALRERQPTADWRRFQTMSQLGASLAEQGKIADAERLLVAGYEGMDLHRTEIPAHRMKELAAAAVRAGRSHGSGAKPETAASSRTGPASRGGAHAQDSP